MIATQTIDPAEIEKFSRVAAKWWDEDGPFQPLHRLNPTRMEYIRARALAHFGRDSRAVEPFKGLSALDVGCGGGLVAEPLARMGFAVTGLDADSEATAAARLHADQRRVAVDYRAGAAEELAAEGKRFDLVLALEVVEHVADRPAFLATVGALVAPGGLLIVSTLNRTLKSLALGVGVAEHVLRWVPAGTHDWRKFVKPSELARDLRAAGFNLIDLTGLAFDPLRGAFALTQGDVAVNYFATAVRG